MDLILKNRKAVVTGGTAGIGKEIVLLFAKQGASVALFGTNAERGQQVVEEAKALSGQPAFFYQVDVAQSGPVTEAMSSAIQVLGGLDILVNNAGITRDQLLLRMSEEDWDLVLDTNLKSVYNTCKSAIKTMMKARYGRIINISSVVGLTGNPGQINYAASKSGMFGLTKSLAKELASRNILVNCIAPGFIETNMTGQLAEEQKEQLLKQIPMARMGRAEEIAFVALFLASEMSSYITGQTLTADGGMVM